MQQELSTTHSIRHRRDTGAMLLAVLFMMAVMVIMALAVAPAMIQQAKRDREEEMIHRGTEYARAVKKYYKKFGRYPANLEQLENTNNIRFLRKRFKDPLAKDGQWKLLRYGDIQTLVGGGGLGAGVVVPGAGGLQSNPQALNALNPAGGQGANLGLGNDQGASTAPVGAQLSPQQQGALVGNQLQNAVQPGGGTSPSPFASGAQGQSGFTLGNSPSQSANSTDQGQNSGQGTTSQGGSNNSIFGNTGVGGQTFGGGAIVGVASKSKDQTIRIYNKKKTYDEWQFIYSPMLDRQNTLLRGPYNGQTFASGQFGTPANQLNQGQNPQQPGGIGQQPGGQQYPQPVQQPNQQLTPGSQFPPDQQQSQPQQ
jgi:type II secretory pathway pseudopilin PulG